jgi:hypothetical protein
MTVSITRNWHSTTVANGYRHYDTRKCSEELDFRAIAEMPPHANAPAYSRSKVIDDRVLDRSHRVWDFDLKCFVYPVEPQPKVVSVNLLVLADRFKVSIRRPRSRS